jgi:hypothetical protein
LPDHEKGSSGQDNHTPDGDGGGAGSPQEEVRQNPAPEPATLPPQAFDAAAFEGMLSDAAIYRNILQTHFESMLRDELQGSPLAEDAALVSVLAGLRSDMFYGLSVSRGVQHAADIPALAPVLKRQAAPRIKGRNKADHVSLGPDMIGRGWHGPDRENVAQFRRWSGPGSLSSIFMDALEPGLYMASGHVRFLVPDAAQDFQMRLDEDFVRPELSNVGGNRYKFFARLPCRNALRSNFTVLEFYCSQVVQPKVVEPQNTDPRKLGFCLFDLSLRKLS